MAYEVIAKFENDNHVYEIHKHDSSVLPPHSGENAYYVVRDDGAQHGAYWDKERAIEDAEDWAGNDSERIF